RAQSKLKLTDRFFCGPRRKAVAFLSMRRLRIISPVTRAPCYSRSKSPMLAELRLENYAVIDNVAVEFAPGLNLLTGETGAGKSILIDALALLLGEKASSDVIRAGAERAIVSAVFEVESGSQKAVSKILENNGLDWEEDSVILRREIAAGGKGRAFVNNQPATVAVLRQLGPHLA